MSFSLLPHLLLQSAVSGSECITLLEIPSLTVSDKPVPVVLPIPPVTRHFTMITLVLVSSSISLVERLMLIMLVQGRLKQVDFPEFKISLGSGVRLSLEKPNQKKQDPSPTLWTASSQESRTWGHMHLLQHPSWLRVALATTNSFCIYWNLLTQQSPKELKQG